MKKYKNKIVLLDAHAIIHRAYHAMPDFARRDGKPTGALYGVSAMIISIISELKPDFVIGCFDLPKPTFRHEAYAEYKGTRKKTDQVLVEQIIESRDIFKAFGIPIYDKAGFEADDLIGTFAEILKKDKDNQIVIASGDMDTFQLVDEDQVVIYTFKKGAETIIYDQKAILKKYEFEPKRVIDYKGLAGDPSDNIPGVAGVGAKTATNLILNFGSVENVYEQLERSEADFIENFRVGKITPRIIKLLKEQKDEAFFSKELATIKLNVDIDFSLPKKDFLENLDLSETGEIFRKYEFRGLNDRLQKALGITSTQEEISRREISPSQIQEAENLKLAVSILNPNIPSPTIDDILNFGQDFLEAKKNIEEEIKRMDLDLV